MKFYRIGGTILGVGGIAMIPLGIIKGVIVFSCLAIIPILAAIAFWTAKPYPIKVDNNAKH